MRRLIDEKYCYIIVTNESKIFYSRKINSNFIFQESKGNELLFLSSSLEETIKLALNSSLIRGIFVVDSLEELKGFKHGTISI